MTRVYWVRNGESQADLDGVFSHRRIDLSLTGDGIIQSRQAASALQNLKFNALYSSPLKRAIETADFISKKTNLPIIPLESFRDVNIGDIETDSPPASGKALFDGIIHSWLLEDGKQVRFPGGEDRYMLTGRVMDGLAHVVGRHPDGCVIIVGHALPLTVTLKEIIHAGEDPRWIGMPMPFGSITEMIVVAAAGRLSADLVCWAKQDHL